MKITVVPSWRTNHWQTRLTQGSQSFDVNSDTSIEDAKWYARMLSKAIKAHNKERDAKQRAGKRKRNQRT